MAGGIDWFRWHHGSVSDPKFQLVAKKAGARLGDVIAVWAFILEKASADADRGAIGPLDFETIDFLLGADDGTATRILDAMSARGLISDSRVVAWEKRQPKREREGDSSSERTKAYRERLKESGDAEERHVTPSDATTGQETPRGEKRREEERSPSLRSGDSAAAQRASRPKREDINLKTYLERCKAEGVKPLPADHPVRAYCADAGISDEMLQVAWCVFRDDYLSGTNKGKRYKDWPGHFANAVRGCWSKLWYTDAGEVKWSSRGLQEKQVLDNRQRAKEASNGA